MLSVQEIMEIIPHRPPFLLIDRIIEMDENMLWDSRSHNQRAVLRRSFSGNPIMPGVLQIEALAQVGAVAVLHQPAYRGKIALFARIETRASLNRSYQAIDSDLKSN